MAIIQPRLGMNYRWKTTDPTIRFTSHNQEQRVTGVITLTVSIPNAVSVTISLGIKEIPATKTGASSWFITWDTNIDPNDDDPVERDFPLFAFAEAVMPDGTAKVSEWLMLVTANKPLTGLPDNAHRPEMDWAADYTNQTAFENSYDTVIGHLPDGTTPVYTLINDPVLGAARKVVRASVPEDLYRPEQPTTANRFQAQAPRDSARAIREGDEVCVGFSYMTTDTFPTMYPNDDPENTADTTPANGSGFINIFQLYGPDNPNGTNSYLGGSPFTIGVRRYSSGERKNIMSIQDFYDGNPYKHLMVPYQPNRWVDVVARMKVSSSVEIGWVELYVNYGQAASVQPLKIAGRVRIPRALRRNPTHQAWRTDVQVYRRSDEFPNVTVLFAGHKHGATVESVDPYSYR